MVRQMILEMGSSEKVLLGDFNAGGTWVYDEEEEEGESFEEEVEEEGSSRQEGSNKHLLEDLACYFDLVQVKAGKRGVEDWTFKFGQQKRRLDYLFTTRGLKESLGKAWIEEPENLALR
eukprot:4134531-Prorocentrum_lima.AAC.1